MLASIYNLPPDELYSKAIIFKEAKDYDNYIIHLTMAANLNHMSAIDKLYDDYCNEHIHKKQDYSKTKNFYETTIEYGFSANYLAWMYEHGKSVPLNYNKAIELYQMAIDKGNSAAINNLAFIYEKGKGLSQDYSKAIALYQLAIEKENSSAMNNLGRMYQNGEGVTQDYNLMKKYYILAINKGNNCAMFWLKYYYTYNRNDLSVIDLYDNKHFHDAAKDIINTIFQNNQGLPESHKQQFANLRFDADIHETVKMKQNILKKTNIWPSNYDSKYLLEFMELLLISQSYEKCLTKDVILYIAGCLFV